MIAAAGAYGTKSRSDRFGSIVDQQESGMNREQAKGVADKAKGAVKDAAGKATGDEKLQAGGKTDEMKGAAHKTVGDGIEAAKNAGR
jgi:uncharacterized protein YjbJ (UPF0337 family)